MKRKYKATSVYLIFLMITIYLVYEAREINEVMTHPHFLEVYLHTFQKHMFNISLFVLVYLSQVWDPYLKEEFYIRYKSKIFFVLLERGAVISLKWSIYILTLYTIIPKFFGYSVTFEYFFMDFLRIFTFIFFLFICVNLLYIHMKNYVLSVICVGVLSFFILLLVSSLNFDILPIGSKIPDSILLDLLLRGSAFFSLINLGYLYFFFKTKDVFYER